MDVYEANKVFKAMVDDLIGDMIGCGELVLVSRDRLFALRNGVEALPTAPPAELKQAYDSYLLFQQVQDANEVLQASTMVD